MGGYSFIEGVCVREHIGITRKLGSGGSKENAKIEK